jgi:hypothetical protein
VKRAKKKFEERVRISFDLVRRTDEMLPIDVLRRAVSELVCEGRTSTVLEDFDVEHLRGDRELP